MLGSSLIVASRSGALGFQLAYKCLSAGGGPSSWLRVILRLRLCKHQLLRAAGMLHLQSMAGTLHLQAIAGMLHLQAMAFTKACRCLGRSQLQLQACSTGGRACKTFWQQLQLPDTDRRRQWP